MATALAVKESVVRMLDGDASIHEIGGFLDALDGEARWGEVSGLGIRHQRDLYDLAVDAPPLTLDDYVPPTVDDLVPVRHRGRNSLPVPGVNHFAKVFTRQPGGAVIGYNDSPVGWLIGPGYYTALATPEEWLDRGAVVVDYYQPPREGPIPQGWPRLRPNWLGAQLFVYHQTRDFMRRVSQHVTIGAAYKWSSFKMDQYFILCRE